MNPSANVKFANHAARSTGTTRRVLSAIESTGSYETDPARPHAPRVGRLNVVAAIGLQFNISRTTESPSATGNGYSKLECECSSPSRLTRQRRRHPPRNPRSVTAWDSKDPCPNCCPDAPRLQVAASPVHRSAPTVRAELPHAADCHPSKRGPGTALITRKQSRPSVESHDPFIEPYSRTSDLRSRQPIFRSTGCAAQATQAAVKSAAVSAS
jgi:hypothetical protein